MGNLVIENHDGQLNMEQVWPVQGWQCSLPLTSVARTMWGFITRSCQIPHGSSHVCDVNQSNYIICAITIVDTRDNPQCESFSRLYILKNVALNSSAKAFHLHFHFSVLLNPLGWKFKNKIRYTNQYENKTTIKTWKKKTQSFSQGIALDQAFYHSF